MTTPEAGYRPRQRFAALAYGAVNHLLFAAAIAMMAFSLFTGMHYGLGPFRGVAGWAANLLLLLQFPLIHSFLLTPSGKRMLGWLAPASLRRELSTTLYASSASIQLILCFLFWSPSGAMVWMPPPALMSVLSVAYAASWLLLLLAMREAGLGLHMGSLGWLAVWRNRAPAYPPLPVKRRLHSRVRQPIYIAFTLILWTSPEWSWDKTALVLLWSAYCVIGAAIKERRYLRYFGETFRAYQASVPFWFPFRRRRAADAGADRRIAIVGGGPVGLLLANLLGDAGHRVDLYEARLAPSERSMAIGITPPSLDILAGLGLDAAVEREGVRIRRATVHEAGQGVGDLDFDRVPGQHAFIVSLPQARTEALLRQRLATLPTVTLHTGHKVTGLAQDRHGADLALERTDTGERLTRRADWVVACDGARSELRPLAGIRATARRYAPSFTMADAPDITGLGDTAHLFFSPERPVESFPLPGGRRRWIIRTGWKDGCDLAEPFADTIARLTGHRLPAPAFYHLSRFQPARTLARRYHRGRVILCGDAAHTLSPIGGQGMNTGFGDAQVLARALDAILLHRACPRQCLAAYERRRKRSFRIASARAAIGMTLGILPGRTASAIRAWLVRQVLARPRMQQKTAHWFTMTSLPHPLAQAARLPHTP